MTSLGCVISFSPYLVLKLVISALTVGICRSVCKIVFGTYHGPLTIDLRTLFWNLCSISVLELLAVPQREMPYVQMGFRIVLYISNLFSSDSFDFLPMIQYMRWSCNPSCFLLVRKYVGFTVAQLVEALRYKPEGRGFDSRWCHVIFSLT